MEAGAVEIELAISRGTFAVLWSSGTWRSPSISNLVTNPPDSVEDSQGAGQYISNRAPVLLFPQVPVKAVHVLGHSDFDENLESIFEHQAGLILIRLPDWFEEERLSLVVSVQDLGERPVT